MSREKRIAIMRYRRQWGLRSGTDACLIITAYLSFPSRYHRRIEGRKRLGLR